MLRALQRNRSGLFFAGTLAVCTIALTLGAQSGGIVPTEYHEFTVEPGPEPDLTIFATGECIGKIEPCG
ncbi:MAG: hypothetical protein ACE5IK_09830 [Acidobacteriota bacterium]